MTGVGRIVGLMVAAALLSTSVAAADTQGRLHRIKESGIMVIAHAETAVPFSYVYDRTPVGFGVDISLRIAEAVKKHLGLSDLHIRWNPTTLSTRFPLIVTNTVDLECVSTTHTREREKLAGFSNSFYMSEDAIASRRDSGYKSYADLAEKKVAVVRGTTTEQALAGRGLNLTLVPVRNNRLAMAALVEGKVDAYIAGAPAVAGEKLRLADPKAISVVTLGNEKAEEAFACMLPREDRELKKIADDVIAGMMASGEMERIYDRWFMNPIPPYGNVVGLPLDSHNRRLYKEPNDTPME